MTFIPHRAPTAAALVLLSVAGIATVTAASPAAATSPPAPRNRSPPR
ncbi:hypothetical protein ACFQX6_03675 [Streptosporangium lutulentum]